MRDWARYARIAFGSFIVGGSLTTLALNACSSSQADRAQLARDAVNLASDACTAYDKQPKRDKSTDSLCLALMLARKAANDGQVVVVPAQGGQ